MLWPLMYLPVSKFKSSTSQGSSLQIVLNRRQLLVLISNSMCGMVQGNEMMNNVALPPLILSRSIRIIHFIPLLEHLDMTDYTTFNSQLMS
jgi:hypothetical protein